MCCINIFFAFAPSPHLFFFASLEQLRQEFHFIQRPINASLEFYEHYNELMNSSDWVLAPLINEVYDAISITDFIRQFNVKRYFTLRSPFSYERTCWLLHCRLIKILNFKCNSERFSIHGCLARIPSI